MNKIRQPPPFDDPPQTPVHPQDSGAATLDKAGGAGAEPPQNLPTAAEVVQTVFPLEWRLFSAKGYGIIYPRK